MEDRGRDLLQEEFDDVRRVVALVTRLLCLIKDKTLITEVEIPDLEAMQTLVEIMHEKDNHIVIVLFSCTEDRIIVSFCTPKEFQPLITCYDLYLKVFEPMKLTNVTLHMNGQNAESHDNSIYSCELIFRVKADTKEIISSAIIKANAVLADLGIVQNAVSPIFLHPRERPPGHFNMDKLRDTPLTTEEELEMSRFMPKYTEVANAAAGQILKTYTQGFNIIHSIDSEAYLELNSLRVNIGSGLFSLPCGRATFATQAKLFHKGVVKIEHLAIEPDLQDVFNEASMNMIVKDSDGNDMILVLREGIFRSLDVPEPTYSQVHIRKLLDAGLVFLQP
jgi:hypothetical protein